jgi:hypothetical protein
VDGVSAAPVAWLLHLIVTILLVYWALGAATQLLLYVASATALLLVATGAYFAARGWQRVGPKYPGDLPGIGSVSRFMAFSWLVTSAFFALVIIAQTVAALTLIAPR